MNGTIQWKLEKWNVQNYHWFRCAARWERTQNRIWAIGRSCSLQCYPKSVMKLCCGFLLLVLVFDTAVIRLMSMGIRFNIVNDNCIGVVRNIYSHFVVGNNVQLDFHTQWSVGTLFKHSSIHRHWHWVSSSLVWHTIATVQMFRKQFPRFDAGHTQLLETF